ncbi:cohesin domain-containing protein [Caproicibacter fermentans]|uniref:Cohesin domain-containing protein n=1 Tax=Caproicibacter fermentans TaxID=2576756 RepID=A0A7G8T8Z7_9FIRM|nr:cohesin domain-containing protein [Caproicibacter fermentans]QNK40088.1 hypothetical protein HCR03_15515 [Caproicibacter fermentans]
MEKKLCLAAAFTCFFLMRLLPASAAAASPTYFSYSLDPVSASGEELVRLNVTAYKTEETAAGFRLKIHYDEDKLDFISTETSGAVKSGTMQTSADSGLISSVYVCNTENGSAPRLSGTIASFLFQVAADAPTGNTALTVSADQICDYDGDSLEADNTEAKLNLKIQRSLSSEARLTELIPSAGSLEPEFAPSVRNYILKVGSDVGSVDFQTGAAGGGSVRVSRKTLNGAGKETQIAVTVTSEDRTQNAQYLITVERAAKDAAGSSITEGKAAGGGPGPSRETESAAREASGGNRSGPGSGSKSSPGFAAGGAGESASGSGGDTRQSEALQAAGDRTLILVGDRMPTFLTGMLLAVLCALVGILLSLWLPIRRKQD